MIAPTIVSDSVLSFLDKDQIADLVIRHMDGDCGDVGEPDFVLKMLSNYFDEKPHMSVFQTERGRPLVVVATSPQDSETICCTAEEFLEVATT